MLVFLILSAVSCTGNSDKKKKDIVQVGDKILSRAEIEENIPDFLSPEDSILTAEHYIRVWINDNLLYNVAQKNITDKKNINQLVENYRKSLIIYQYQEQLVNEKVSKEISNDVLWNYFKENQDKFKLDKPLIKGLFLKIPAHASQIDKVRTWYKSLSPASIENIEKYSVQNAAGYDYFVDNWVDFNEIMDKWPVKYKNELETIKGNKFFEQEDDNYFYFLHITAYLLPGDNAPYEYAKMTVKEILINQKKIEFLRKTEEDLYNKALDKGQIIFFNE
jgi:hypothetical protein